MLQLAARRKRQEAQRQQELDELLSNAPHPADGPQVMHVGAVAPNILAITLEDGAIQYRPQTFYQAQPGDEITDEEKGNTEHVLQRRHGKIVDALKERSLYRLIDGRRQQVGHIVEDDTVVAPGLLYKGLELAMVSVDQSQAYRISSADDSVFETPVAPAKVFVKCKPIGQAKNQIPVRCIVYLQTPQPLKQGASYTVEFRGINTRQPQVVYRHEPRSVRSDAIHVTQVGYRPADPFKRAYLSTWLGTGGELAYDAAEFELLDAQNRKLVYRGKIELGFATDRPEAMSGAKNQTQTNVYYLDFHEFQQPGEYLVHVPGIGVSYPLTIGDDVWQEVFQIAMHGFLSHRSGIELQAPFTDYHRPRPMHPADGARIFELDITFWDGEATSVDRAFRRLLTDKLEGSRLSEYPDAWGGYMDAGDWDRRSQHLRCTLALLELCDLFPDYFAKRQLTLPEDEARDAVPDVLNEALWNLACYRRMQRRSWRCRSWN